MQLGLINFKSPTSATHRILKKPHLGHSDTCRIIWQLEPDRAELWSTLSQAKPEGQQLNLMVFPCWPDTSMENSAMLNWHHTLWMPIIWTNIIKRQTKLYIVSMHKKETISTINCWNKSTTCHILEQTHKNILYHHHWSLITQEHNDKSQIPHVLLHIYSRQHISIEVLSNQICTAKKKKNNLRHSKPLLCHTLDQRLLGHITPLGSRIRWAKHERGLCFAVFTRVSFLKAHGFLRLLCADFDFWCFVFVFLFWISCCLIGSIYWLVPSFVWKYTSRNLLQAFQQMNINPLEFLRSAFSKSSSG